MDPSKLFHIFGACHIQTVREKSETVTDPEGVRGLAPIISSGEKFSCVYSNMPGKKGRFVGILFIFFIFFFKFQRKCIFLFLQHRFCIHNGKRKLMLTNVSANLVLFYFLRVIASFFVLFYEYILEKCGKKFTVNRIPDRLAAYLLILRMYD